MFDKIDQNILKHIGLNHKELEYFHSLLKFKKIKKKSFLLQPGEVCTFEGFINKGCVRVYFLDEKGAEVDLVFAIEDWWVSDLASFTQQKPAELFIQALENCEMLFITYKDKEKLYSKIPSFERFFRILTQRSYDTVIKRLVSTIARPAEERYLHFLEKYPAIPQRVPQHLIAAYLGISPEFLSKIRARRAKT
ncbi:MAG: Crp/Fnr family transcriptional regulator [Bacteroidia bacterium]